MPDDSVSILRHLKQHESPVTVPKLRVEIDPPTAATRSEASWPGLAAEVVHITASLPFKCDFLASCHLLMSVSRGTLAHGESRVRDAIARPAGTSAGPLPSYRRDMNFTGPSCR